MTSLRFMLYQLRRNPLSIIGVVIILTFIIILHMVIKVSDGFTVRRPIIFVAQVPPVRLFRGT